MKTLAWEERFVAFKTVLMDGRVCIEGKDLPDVNDPSDPQFEVEITVTSINAFVDIYFNDLYLETTGIPSLENRVTWDKHTVSYLKHWLFKVLEDPIVYRANKILILSEGNWRKFTK